MKKGVTLAVATAFGFILMAGAGSAYALLLEPMHVKVPFDFVIGETTLPAGEYQISNVDDTATDLLVIRSENGQPAFFFEAEPASPKGDVWVSDTKLTFQKVNGKEYLTGIWEAGGNTGYSLKAPASTLTAEHAERSGGK